MFHDVRVYRADGSRSGVGGQQLWSMKRVLGEELEKLRPGDVMTVHVFETEADYTAADLEGRRPLGGLVRDLEQVAQDVHQAHHMHTGFKTWRTCTIGACARLKKVIEEVRA